jgi:protein-S-isoprenylcysteine O-methyltransferase Ste14
MLAQPFNLCESLLRKLISTTEKIWRWERCDKTNAFVYLSTLFLLFSVLIFFLSSCRSGGPGLLLGGTVIVLKAFGDLGSDSLSPFPSPPKGATLKMDGIYQQMRHPMYTGLMMIMAGLAIATDSADRLLLTALLWFLIDIKANKEEGTLRHWILVSPSFAATAKNESKNHIEIQYRCILKSSK